MSNAVGRSNGDGKKEVNKQGKQWLASANLWVLWQCKAVCGLVVASILSLEVIQ